MDNNDWLMSEEELDEYIGAVDDGEELPPLAAEEQAQSYVRAYAYHQRELDAIQARAAREIAAVKAWASDEEAKIERRTSWLYQMLQSFMWSVSAKSIKFPAGTLKRTKGRERVTVADESAFIASYRDTEMVRVKEEVAKSAIAKHIKATGEVPEGVEMERADDVFSIKLEERNDE